MTLKNSVGKCSLFVLSANGWKDQNMDPLFPAKENPDVEIYGPSTSSNLYYGPENLRPEIRILNGFLSMAQQMGYRQRISQALQTLICKLFYSTEQTKEYYLHLLYAEFVLHKVTLRDEVFSRDWRATRKVHKWRGREEADL